MDEEWGWDRLKEILESITGRPFATDTLNAVAPAPVEYRYHEWGRPGAIAWVDETGGPELNVGGRLMSIAQDQEDPDRFVEQILSHEVGHQRDLNERPYNMWLEPFRNRERVAWEEAALLDALRDVPMESVVDSARVRSDRWMDRDPRKFFPMPRWMKNRRLERRLEGILGLLGGQ